MREAWEESTRPGMSIAVDEPIRKAAATNTRTTTTDAVTRGTRADDTTVVEAPDVVDGRGGGQTEGGGTEGGETEGGGTEGGGTEGGGTAANVDGTKGGGTEGEGTEGEGTEGGGTEGGGPAANVDGTKGGGTAADVEARDQLRTSRRTTCPGTGHKRHVEGGRRRKEKGRSVGRRRKEEEEGERGGRPR